MSRIPPARWKIYIDIFVLSQAAIYRFYIREFKWIAPIHSWNTATSKFDLENLKSGSWWIQRSRSYSGSNIHRFISLSFYANCTTTAHILEIKLYKKKLILKIQGQSHGWDQMSRSYSEANILLIHIPFIQCQSNTAISKFNLENPRSRSWVGSKVKVI